MPFFAVNYAYVPDAAALDEVRPVHRAYLRSLVERGALRASGPFLAGDPGALLLFRAESAEAVRAMVDEDPIHLAGLVVRSTITPWNPVIGIFADELD